jgi:hypothetical protein
LGLFRLRSRLRLVPSLGFGLGCLITFFVVVYSLFYFLRCCSLVWLRVTRFRFWLVQLFVVVILLVVIFG